jgi:ABC-type transporter Mla MlaB component
VVSVTDLEQGTHACCRFEDHDHKRGVVGAYVAEGLRRGERVAVYTRGNAGESLLPASLTRADIARLTDSGQLVLRSAEDGYFSGGGFDGAAQAADFEDFADKAVAEGYEGLRVYADNGWMPGELENPLDWLEYELRISQTIHDRRLTGLCGFEAADGDVVSLSLIDAVHPERVMPADDRPSQFHITSDGIGLAVNGELDHFCVGDLLQVLTAARPLLVTGQLSLAGVTFVDAAAAQALSGFIDTASPIVRDTSPVVQRVWSLIDAAPAGSPS